MYAHVPLQIAQVDEAYATLVTGVGFFSGVGQAVSPQAPSGGETALTLRTGEGLLSCVRLPVFFQVDGLGEGFVTLVALERTRAGVQEGVSFQVSRGGERLPTLLTSGHCGFVDVVAPEGRGSVWSVLGIEVSFA